jgi:hypothetical protein
MSGIGLFAVGIFLMPAAIKQRVLNLALFVGAIIFRRALTYFTEPTENPTSPGPRLEPEMTGFRSTQEATTVGPHIVGPAPSAPPVPKADETDLASDSLTTEVLFLERNRLVLFYENSYLFLLTRAIIKLSCILVCSEMLT